MNYRRLVLMAALVGLVASGATASALDRGRCQHAASTGGPVRHGCRWDRQRVWDSSN